MQRSNKQLVRLNDLLDQERKNRFYFKTKPFFALQKQHYRKRFKKKKKQKQENTSSKTIILIGWEILLD